VRAGDLAIPLAEASERNFFIVFCCRKALKKLSSARGIAGERIVWLTRQRKRN